jgi:hypothetical protein
MSNPSCCWLCGILIDTKLKRYQNRKALQDFVKEKCTVSPFVYNWLISTSGDDQKYPVCVPCVNWKRRASKLPGTRKALLQLDQLILFLLSPGEGREPDQRCMARLITAVKQVGNPYRLAIPTPVHSILLLMPEAPDLSSVVKSWWEYNGRTDFFNNPNMARMVRSVQK